MSKRHYHVTFGSQGGYLPDEGATFTSRRAAEQQAAEWARNELELYDEEDGVTKLGSAREGFIAIEKSGSLGYVIEVTPCVETDCESEDDA